MIKLNMEELRFGLRTAQRFVRPAVREAEVSTNLDQFVKSAETRFFPSHLVTVVSSLPPYPEVHVPRWKTTREQFDILIHHISKGLHLIRNGQYEATIDHFLDPTVMQKLGMFLDSDIETFSAMRIKTEAEAIALLKRVQNVGHFSMSNGVHYRIPGEIPTIQIGFIRLNGQHSAKEILDHHGAYTLLEEWLHGLQRASHRYISKHLADVPYSSLPSNFTEEDDIAWTFIEHRIPLPKNFLQLYDRELLDQHPDIIWSKHNKLHRGCPEMWDLPDALETIQAAVHKMNQEDEITISRHSEPPLNLPRKLFPNEVVIHLKKMSSGYAIWIPENSHLLDPPLQVWSTGVNATNLGEHPVHLDHQFTLTVPGGFLEI